MTAVTAATPATPDEFLAVFPEFKDVPVERVRFQLDLASMSQSRSAWGLYWRHAVMLEVAHTLALTHDISAGLEAAGKTGVEVGGITTSMSASPSSLSESRAVPAWMTGDSVIDSNYGRTEYGQQYLLLLIKVIPAGEVVFSPPVRNAGHASPGYRSRFK